MCIFSFNKTEWRKKIQILHQTIDTCVFISPKTSFFIKRLVHKFHGEIVTYTSLICFNFSFK